MLLVFDDFLSTETRCIFVLYETHAQRARFSRFPPANLEAPLVYVVKPTSVAVDSAEYASSIFVGSVSPSALVSISTSVRHIFWSLIISPDTFTTNTGAVTAGTFRRFLAALDISLGQALGSAVLAMPPSDLVDDISIARYSRKRDKARSEQREREREREGETRKGADLDQDTVSQKGFVLHAPVNASTAQKATIKARVKFVEELVSVWSYQVRVLLRSEYSAGAVSPMGNVYSLLVPGSKGHGSMKERVRERVAEGQRRAPTASAAEREKERERERERAAEAERERDDDEEPKSKTDQFYARLAKHDAPKSLRGGLHQRSSTTSVVIEGKVVEAAYSVSFHKVTEQAGHSVPLSETLQSKDPQTPTHLHEAAAELLRLLGCTPTETVSESAWVSGNLRPSSAMHDGERDRGRDKAREREAEGYGDRAQEGVTRGNDKDLTSSVISVGEREREAVARPSTQDIPHLQRDAFKHPCASLSTKYTALLLESATTMQLFRYWVQRYRALRAVSDQLSSSQFRVILRAVETARSSLSSTVARIVRDVTKAKEEADQMVHAVSFLLPYIARIHNAALDNYWDRHLLPTSVDEIRDRESWFTLCDTPTLGALAHALGLIWRHGHSVGTGGHYVSMLSAVSCDLLFAARQFIGPDDALFNDPLSYGKRVRHALGILSAYKSAFLGMRLRLTSQTGKNWNVSDAAVFSALDPFIQRCVDVYELCDTLINFTPIADLAGDHTDLVPVRVPIAAEQLVGIFHRLRPPSEETDAGILSYAFLTIYIPDKLGLGRDSKGRVDVSRLSLMDTAIPSPLCSRSNVSLRDRGIASKRQFILSVCFDDIFHDITRAITIQENIVVSVMHQSLSQTLPTDDPPTLPTVFLSRLLLVRPLLNRDSVKQAFAGLITTALTPYFALMTRTGSMLKAVLSDCALDPSHHQGQGQGHGSVCTAGQDGAQTSEAADLDKVDGAVQPSSLSTPSMQALPEELRSVLHLHASEPPLTRAILSIEALMGFICGPLLLLIQIGEPLAEIPAAVEAKNRALLLYTQMVAERASVMRRWGW
ncbi:dynein heavy chain [Kipferlia bialata]|uniref:Dynein heavy chain n=1 Tax=Kipferlia bialata TaxID=797122 RepID=A0A9K3CR62_9EUKA|nr:dynein heavy chain [Kipferlia bialata]|eukprot:g2019.t1